MKILMKLRRKQPTSVQTKYGGLNSQEPAVTYYLFKLKNSSKFEEADQYLLRFLFSLHNRRIFTHAGQRFFLGKNA